MQTDTKIAILKGKKIRKTLYQNEWWFSIVDICGVLTDRVDSESYWRKLKQRLAEEGCEVETICNRLKVEVSNGEMRKTDCVNAEGMFRIIQSIPSPKAEVFKRWLAKVGDERVQEIKNPELATKRTRILYKLKGYSDDWIEKRLLGINIEAKLTDEWQKRGAEEEKDYEILTVEISKATFGITPDEYKNFKGLKRENLRDHMNDLELIFTMLGERSTTAIHRNENSKGMHKLKSDAKAGGNIAGNARKALEKRLKKPIVSAKNYLKEKESQKRIKK